MYSISCPGYINSDTVNILIEANDGVYVLEYDYQPRTTISYLNNINLILSTFKFTDTSDWKTLYDSDGARSAVIGSPILKYSFRYPTNFQVFKTSGVDSYYLLGTYPPNSITYTTMFVYTYLMRVDYLAAHDDITDIISTTKATLGGKEAARIYGTEPNPTGPSIVYRVLNLQWTGADKRWGFQFRCAFDKIPSDYLINLCDQIASTFQFIK